MLGMIFGVAAVIAMLSIGAGAQQQVIAFIEQLGVRNVIVEAREATRLADAPEGPQALGGPDVPGSAVDSRRTSPASTRRRARKRFVPTQVLPKPHGDMPAVYGVAPAYQQIAGLRDHARPVLHRGRSDARRRRSPCSARRPPSALFGGADPIGQFVKVNEQWFRVIGVAGPQLAAQGDVGGLPAQDRNNLIYVPTHRRDPAARRLTRAARRTRSTASTSPRAATRTSSATGALVRGLLETTHSGAGDFTRHRAGRAARAAAAHQAAVRVRHGRDRVDLAAGRRHRHHEHHARERHGADARDRRPPRRRRDAARRRPPVPESRRR